MPVVQPTTQRVRGLPFKGCSHMRVLTLTSPKKPSTPDLRILHGQVFVGLLARDHLMVLLRRVMARGLPGAGGERGPDIAFEDLSRHFVSAAARSLILEQQMAVLQARPPGAGL